jgi:hypothetical protein
MRSQRRGVEWKLVIIQCSSRLQSVDRGQYRIRRHIFAGFEVLKAVVTKIYIFWDIRPCSLVKINRRFGGIRGLHLQFRRISQGRNQLATRFTLVSSSAYFSTLKMEETCSSETSVDFQRAARRYIPEDRILQWKVFPCPVRHHALKTYGSV